MLRKALAPHMSPLVQVFYLTLGLIPLLAVWCWHSPTPTLTVEYGWVVTLAVALNVIANVAYVRALQVSPLSLTVPLLSLTPAITALVAVPILGEVPSLLQGLGILLVAMGALLLTAPARDRRSLWTWLQAFGREKGSRLMALVALCWSLSLPLDKIGVLAVGPAWHALILVSGITLGTVLVLLVGRRLGEITEVRGRAWPLLGAAVAVSMLAFGLQLVLIRWLDVGILEATKRAFGNFAALGFGALLFREPLTRAKWLATSVLALGVALILL